jgi:hypothetical protein
MSRSRSVTSVELSMSRPGRGAMNTTPIMRTVAAIGMTCLLSGSLLLAAVTPASARPDPGPPLPSAPGRIAERRVEVPVPIDDNAVEPAQVALGAVGGAGPRRRRRPRCYQHPPDRSSCTYTRSHRSPSGLAVAPKSPARPQRGRDI